MACDICGRGNCTASFHTTGEQIHYEKVIEAFERARELREQVRSGPDDDSDAEPEDV